jgi:hypothetical protein
MSNCLWLEDDQLTLIEVILSARQHFDTRMRSRSGVLAG